MGESLRSCTVYWLFLSLTCSVVINGQVDVSFIPSPPITTVDTAIYNCSSNVSAVTIQWFIGDSGTPTHNDNNLISAGVITIGDGTTTSSLIIPGNLTQFNDTLISCLADGRIGNVITGTPVDEVRSAPLLIQGKLDGVGDLMTQPDGPCCINITWSPPYTLSGVPILGYNINITKFGDVITNTTNTTEWRYCPEKSGEYIISVGAVNGVGEGNITNTSGMIEESKYNVTKMKLVNQTLDNKDTLHWMIQVNISVNGSVCIDRIDNIQLNCTCSSFRINSTNVTINPDDRSNMIATYTPYVNKTNNFNHTFTLNVINSEGDMDHYDVPITIRFVSVINVTVDIQSDNIVFTCHFISGSFATGCHIRLFQDDSLLHNITVTRQDNDITGSTSLPKDSILSGTYTIEVYDEYNNISIPNIAYSTTINITVPTSTDSVDIPSVTDSSILMSPTVDATIPTDPVPPIIIAVIIIIILLVIVIIILCAIFIIYKRYCKRNKKISVVNYYIPDVPYTPNERSYNGRSIPLNYIDVDHTNDETNCAIPPSPMEPQPCQYVTIGPSQLTPECLYEQSPNMAATNTPSCDDQVEYAKLNRSINTPPPVSPHGGGGGGQYSTLPAEYTRNNTDGDNITQINKELSQRELLQYVVPYVKHKWHEMGIALSLTPPQLDDLEENHQGISDVFQLWEELKTRPFTWDTLLMALRSPQVNEHDLAKQLELSII